jgi:UDP-MurNAc hydroxylase
MRVTCLGHAGLLIETRHGSVLCDPWFGPAYYASWFPFPDNSMLRDDPRVRRPDWLYVSHSHADHFDREFCAELPKSTPVILPEYPLDELERELRGLGFTEFVHTRHGRIERLGDGDLQVVCLANVSPADGPMGDSGLVVYDGETRVFDQNDSRPQDLRQVNLLGPYDAHFAQHSGAAWFPMVYSLPRRVKAAMGRRKRANQLQRFLHYADAVGATFVVPGSGPPCFLDDELRGLNDLGDDPANVFPDQTLALAQLGERGRMMLPGWTAEITPVSFEVVDGELDPEEVFGAAKAPYLAAYALREAAAVDAVYARLQPVDDLFGALAARMVPLVERTHTLAAGIGGRVVIGWGDDELALDFATGRVGRWHGEPYVHRITLERRLLEDMLARGVENWVDDMWPSCRFHAHRRGPYNDYVGSFFRCLTPERLEYAERWYAERDHGDNEWWETDGWRIQRFCPHMRGDLAQVGRLEDGGVLVCAVHGLRYDLKTGRCLDAEGLSIRAERL